jgi:uncharacterized protein
VFHVLSLTYLQPLDVIDNTRQRHVPWLQQEIEDGRLLLAGRQEDQSGGVLITTNIGADEAENVTESDPTSRQAWSVTSGSGSTARSGRPVCRRLRDYFPRPAELS